jgi:hypothetical protein
MHYLFRLRRHRDIRGVGTSVNVEASEPVRDVFTGPSMRPPSYANLRLEFRASISHASGFEIETQDARPSVFFDYSHVH